MEIDGTLIEMMKKHLAEASIREQKITEIEMCQKSVANELITGNKRFETLNASMSEINVHLVNVLHTLNGNGQPGIIDKVNKHHDLYIGVRFLIGIFGITSIASFFGFIYIILQLIKYKGGIL